MPHLSSRFMISATAFLLAGGLLQSQTSVSRAQATRSASPTQFLPPIKPSVPSEGATGGKGGTGETKSPAESKINKARLEVEHVTVNDFGAEPASIQRPAGPFYLYITNRTRNVKAQFSIAPASGATKAAQISTLTSALQLDRLAAAKRVAGIFDAPKGQYFLKSEISGKVFLTITIQ